MSRRTTAVALLALLLVLAGCVGGQNPLEGASQAPEDAQDGTSPLAVPDLPNELPITQLDRQRFLEGQVHVQRDEPGWQVVRVVATPELWKGDWSNDGGNVELKVLVAVDSQPGSNPYVAVVLHHPGQGGDPINNALFFALNESEPATATVELQSACSSDCGPAPPRAELAFVAGGSSGATAMRIGLVDRAPRDPAAGVGELRARNELPISADFAGPDGFAGTHIDLDVGPDHRISFTVGALEVEREATLEAPQGVVVDDRLRVHGERALPAPGLGSALMVATEGIGLSQWAIDWELADKGYQAEGLWLDAGPRGTGQVPASIGVVQTGAGDGHVELSRTFSGRSPGLWPVEAAGPLAAHVVLATWGWVGADLPSLYGWDWQDFVMPPPRDDGSPTPTVGLHQRICIDPGPVGACLEAPLGQVPVVGPLPGQADSIRGASR